MAQLKNLLVSGVSRTIGKGYFGGLVSTAANEFIHNTNEFNFIPTGYSDSIYINYLDSSRNDATVFKYIFCTGKGSDGAGKATIKASTFEGNLTGNAATATTLQTARTIFGKNFNGSADVAGQGLFYGTYNATAANRYATGGIQIREQGQVGSAQSDIGYAPSIGFHWGGKTAASLLYHSDGNFYLKKQDGTTRASLDANLIGNASTATSATSASRALKIETYKTADKTATYGNQWQVCAYWETNNGPIRLASDQSESSYNVIVDLADSATKATQDGSGNTITSYYCTLGTTQTLSGVKTFTQPIGITTAAKVQYNSTDECLEFIFS